MQSSFVAQPMSRMKIRQLANHFRDILGLKDAQYIPIVPILEYAMYELDERFCHEIKPVAEMGIRHGVTYPEKHTIHIREDVYINACNGIGRDRFTIAHEIGHYLMHRPGNIALARISQGQTIKIYCDPEWQANTFAGELLAPPHIIAGMSKDEVVRLCGVSLKVAQIQLRRAR